MSGHDAHDRDDVVRRLRATLHRRAADVEVTPAFADRVDRQRRHRTVTNRVALAVAATAVLAAVAVLGANLLAAPQRLELVGPDVAAAGGSEASAGPTASASASTRPTPGPTADAAPGAPASEPDVPDDGQTPQTAPAIGTSGIEDLASALLVPDDLPVFGQAAWLPDARSAQPRPSSDLFDPCAPTAYPTDALREEVRTADIRQDVEAEGDFIRQNVARYPSDEVAAEAVAGFRRVTEACAHTADEVGDVQRHTIVDASSRSLLIHSVPDIGAYSTYAVVVRRGEVVALVQYYPGETREADGRARQIADAVTGRLDDAQ